MQATFDGFLRPDKVGKTADVYVVDHMDPADWLKPPASAPGLADVSGGAEALTVQPVSASESSLEKNVIDVWAVADAPGRYDVVFDFGTDADDPDTPDGKYDPSVDLIDSLTSTSAGFFVVEDPGTIVATEGGVPITETGFAEYIMETRKEVFVNGTFKSHVTLRGRIRYPAATTLVATRPVILGTGNGTASTPSPVGGASPEFFEAVYSKPFGAANGSWYLIGEGSSFVEKIPAVVTGTSVTWTLDQAGKFTGAIITEGTTPFISGDRIYFTITREPLAGARSVVFVVHGNHPARLATEPTFIRPPLPDPTIDPNLIIMKSDIPLRARYQVRFDGATSQWTVRRTLASSAPIPPPPTIEGMMGFDEEKETSDTHLTLLIKSFPAVTGDTFIIDTDTDTNTPDRSYRGYDYLADHLARNGFVTVSISLDDWALINSTLIPPMPGGAIGARFEVLEETITQLRSGTGVPDILTGKLDFSDLSAIGHSRGGEVVTLVLKAGGLDVNRGVSIAPTRFTAVADPTDKKDFLVIYGAYDSDVDDGSPFQLYDAAEGLRHVVFADKANHNFFNRSWAQDEGLGTLDVAAKTKHEEVARAYTMAFLLDSLHGQQEFRDYFVRDTTSLKPPSVTIPADSISIQSLPPRVNNMIVDEYDDLPATNTLGRAVSGVNLDLFDDIKLEVPPIPPPPALPIPPVRNYYQDTHAGIVELDVITGTKPVYRSQTDIGGGNLNVSNLSFVTLRMAQEHGHVNNPRAEFDFSVALTDLQEQQSIVDAGSFGFTVPASYHRLDATGTEVAGEPHKSHFKTVRIPLWAFTADGRRLNLNEITDVWLVFDKPRAGRNQAALGVDDLVFEK